jgi:Protein of unknown function (DUF2800)
MTPTPQPDDERLNLPSASSFARVVACAGSTAMIASLPPEALVEEVDEVTSSGTKIHAALETSNTLDLDEEELKLYEAGVRNENELVSQWTRDNGIEIFKKCESELRLWLHDEALNPIASGKLDAHYISADGKHLLISDAKSGFLFNRLNSATSYQLRLQAVLAMKEYAGVVKIRVAYNKLMARSGASDYADYDIIALTNAEAEARYRIWLSNQPGANRSAGQHCNWCPARGHCPEAAAMSLLPSTLAPNGMLEKIDLLSPADLKAIWQKQSIIKKILERVSDRLKGLDAAALESLGLALGKGRKLDAIVATQNAFARLEEAGIEQHKLFEAMSFSKTELTKLVRAEKGISEKDAAIWLDRLLDDCIERKTGEGALKEL